MKTVTILTKPIPAMELTFTQEKLKLSDEEMSDEEALIEYIEAYYLPLYFWADKIISITN